MLCLKIWFSTQNRVSAKGSDLLGSSCSSSGTGFNPVSLPPFSAIRLLPGSPLPLQDDLLDARRRRRLGSSLPAPCGRPRECRLEYFGCILLPRLFSRLVSRLFSRLRCFLCSPWICGWLLAASSFSAAVSAARRPPFSSARRLYSYCLLGPIIAQSSCESEIIAGPCLSYI